MTEYRRGIFLASAHLASGRADKAREIVEPLSSLVGGTGKPALYEDALKKSFARFGTTDDLATIPSEASEAVRLRILQNVLLQFPEHRVRMEYLAAANERGLVRGECDYESKDDRIRTALELWSRVRALAQGGEREHAEEMMGLHFGNMQFGDLFEHEKHYDANNSFVTVTVRRSLVAAYLAMGKPDAAFRTLVTQKITSTPRSLEAEIPSLCKEIGNLDGITNVLWIARNILRTTDTVAYDPQKYSTLLTEHAGMRQRVNVDVRARARCMETGYKLRWALPGNAEQVKQEMQNLTTQQRMRLCYALAIVAEERNSAPQDQMLSLLGGFRDISDDQQ